MHRFMVGVLLLSGVAVSYLPARAADNTATATCNFEDGKQMSVRYDQESGKTLHNGKVWTPGNEAMTLFTQTELLAGNADIPVGAYSLYIIPGKDNWTLIVNKNVSAPTKYDEHQDIVRMTMEKGELGQAEKQFNIVFGQMGPKQCNMRIYYGTTGTWAEFQEK